MYFYSSSGPSFCKLFLPFHPVNRLRSREGGCAWQTGVGQQAIRSWTRLVNTGKPRHPNTHIYMIYIYIRMHMCRYTYIYLLVCRYVYASFYVGYFWYVFFFFSGGGVQRLCEGFCFSVFQPKEPHENLWFDTGFCPLPDCQISPGAKWWLIERLIEGYLSLENEPGTLNNQFLRLFQLDNSKSLHGKCLEITISIQFTLVSLGFPPEHINIWPVRSTVGLDDPTGVSSHLASGHFH